MRRAGLLTDTIHYEVYQDEHNEYGLGKLEKRPVFVSEPYRARVINNNISRKGGTYDVSDLNTDVTFIIRHFPDEEHPYLGNALNMENLHVVVVWDSSRISHDYYSLRYDVVSAEFDQRENTMILKTVYHDNIIDIDQP